jgi:hypothetical protein
MTQRRGGIRGILHRLTADPDRLDADDLREEVGRCGATPIADCPDREPVYLSGTLRTVKLRPRAGVPALEAELWDGTGAVTVVWLGRREIPGIQPGRRIRVRGRITTFDGHRALYNPVYELRPSGETSH